MGFLHTKNLPLLRIIPYLVTWALERHSFGLHLRKIVRQTTNAREHETDNMACIRFCHIVCNINSYLSYPTRFPFFPILRTNTIVSNNDVNNPREGDIRRRIFDTCKYIVAIILTTKFFRVPHDVSPKKKKNLNSFVRLIFLTCLTRDNSCFANRCLAIGVRLFVRFRLIVVRNKTISGLHEL